MTKSLKALVVTAALVGLTACGGGGGDTIVTPDIPVAPEQPDTPLSFAELTTDFDALSSTVDGEDNILLGAFPTTSTASYSGQFTGDLGIQGTTTTGAVAGTVEITLDFATPENSVGSIGNLQSPTIDGIEGQVDFLVQNYSSVQNNATNPAIISGIFGSNLTVSDPDFAAKPSGSANGLFVGGATGTGADRLFMNLIQPEGTPTDYTFTGALVAD